ncbi:MAG: hypothetical protein ABFD82_22940 [Syntrophaceae bacterium]
MSRKLNIHKSNVVLFIMLSAFVFFMSGCAGSTTYVDLMPQSFPGNIKIQKIEGSINVLTSVPKGTTNPTYKKMDVDEWLDSKKLKEAIEKSIVEHTIFSQVSQGSADYVLEVWVEKIQNVLEITGEGFVFDLMSIWRLTRVKDGKVVACEFVKGHGGAHGFAARAYPPGISAATRNMVQKGLFAISDQSQSHLSAMSTAGSRPGIVHAD